ncbi:glutathione S-transferase A-like isoform X2 [Syngnathus acus]|uniref:glutathione S-transferase A-like isoform X2 n=1 Tax=Syngnathus acus TaxID=161584 RepID=UPI001885BADD|nr:glutathione S-transferase A-like isoform X2 [Syngnathus acus]
MAKNMSLLWCSGSPPCWMVMIALAEKNLYGYHQKRLSVTNMAHRTPELMAINPRGQVPAFRHGDRVLNESLSACLYLENQFKEQGNKLIPSCPAEQAMMYQRMMEGTVLFQKSIAIIHHSCKVPKKEECDSAMGEIHEELRKEVKLWERYRKEIVSRALSESGRILQPVKGTYKHQKHLASSLAVQPHRKSLNESNLSDTEEH